MMGKVADKKTRSGSLISMTGPELLRVCAITKDHDYLCTIPLSRIVDRVLESSVGMVQSWEFLDLTLDMTDMVKFCFDEWFSWGDTGLEEMVLLLRFKNLEFGNTEELEIDIIQLIRNEIQGKSDKLYIGGAEITSGAECLKVNGKEISLKDGVIRVTITTEEPSWYG